MRLFRFALLSISLLVLDNGTIWAGEFPDDYFFSKADRPASLKALEGQPAKSLELDEWIGEETSIEDLKGQVIVVDFWATWCGPCMAAIPKNIALVDKYKGQGMALIGVHDSNSGWDKASGVVNDKKINYPVARDKGGSSTKAYGLQFWPTYVVIDRKGVVRAAGLVPDKVEDVIKILLKEPGGPSDDASTTGEFPPEWYVGGKKRLPGMTGLEGKPAPDILTASEDEWIGDPSVLESREGRITVVRFLAPLNLETRQALPAWKKTADSLTPHGVVFLGICDYQCKWADMQSLVETETTPFPITRDQAPEEDGLPLGRTALTYGVRIWPTTVVIDRAGHVRAAGIKEDHLQAVIETLMAEPGDLPPGDEETNGARTR